MIKPGSHRGSNETKKKHFSNGNIRKKPVQLLDKVRDEIISIRDNEDSYKIQFCNELAKKLKCKIGLLIVCINKLQKEGLVSSIRKRRLSFTVYSHENDTKQELESKKLEILYNYTNCPICNNTLKETSYGFFSFELNCSNRCFMYKAYDKKHTINIFRIKTEIPMYTHNSFKNKTLQDVNKNIEKMKHNNKYIMEILSPDY